MEMTYHFRRSERNPVVFLAFVTGLGMIAAALLYGPPPRLWWLPVGGTTLGALWIFAANREHGVDLTPEALTVVHAGRSDRWPLSEIDHLEISDWSEGASYRLHLKDGRRVALFGGSFPHHRVMQAAAHAAGLAVTVR